MTQNHVSATIVTSKWSLSFNTRCSLQQWYKFVFVPWSLRYCFIFMNFLFPPMDFCVKESLPPIWYTKLFWVLLAGWPDGRFAFWLVCHLLCKICSQHFDPVQLCLSFYRHHQPVLSAGIYNFPLVQVILGNNTPKYFQRVKLSAFLPASCGT